MANVAGVSQLMETVGVPAAQAATPVAVPENTQSFATVMQQANTEAGVPAPVEQSAQSKVFTKNEKAGKAADESVKEQAFAAIEDTSSQQTAKSATPSLTAAPQQPVASRYTQQNMLLALLRRTTSVPIPTGQTAVLSTGAGAIPKAPPPLSIIPAPGIPASGIPASGIPAPTLPAALPSPGATQSRQADLSSKVLQGKTVLPPPLAASQLPAPTTAKPTPKVVTVHSAASKPDTGGTAASPGAPPTVSPPGSVPVIAQQLPVDLTAVSAPLLPPPAPTSAALTALPAEAKGSAKITAASSTPASSTQPTRAVSSNLSISAIAAPDPLQRNTYLPQSGPTPGAIASGSLTNVASNTVPVQNATAPSGVGAKSNSYVEAKAPQAGAAPPTGTVPPAANLKSPIPAPVAIPVTLQAAPIVNALPAALPDNHSTQATDPSFATVATLAVATPLPTQAIQQAGLLPVQSTGPATSVKSMSRSLTAASATTSPAAPTPAAQAAPVQPSAADAKESFHPPAAAAPAQPSGPTPSDSAAIVSAPVTATHTPIAVTTLSNANGPALGSTPFATAHTASADTLPHTTLSSTPTTLEVGVSSGTHGWLKIRAELNESGTVDASLTGTNAAASGRLRSDLPALSSFLQDEKVALGSLNVTTTNNATSATASAVHTVSSTLEPVSSFTRSAAEAVGATSTAVAADAGTAGGRAPQQQAQQGSGPTLDIIPVDDSRTSAIAVPAHYGDSNDLGGSGVLSEDSYGSGGSWLNVRV